MQKNILDTKSIMNQFDLRFIQFSQNIRIQILINFLWTINWNISRDLRPGAEISRSKSIEIIWN